MISNGMVGKRVLIVGIGNSAIDAATNCASIGQDFDNLFVTNCRKDYSQCGSQ